jgi:hypothetical protein
LILNVHTLAWLGGVVLLVFIARMSQIMGLTELAPAIQEELLFLPRTVLGRDRIYENELREIAREVDWEQQQRLFRSVMDSTGRRRA